jgi:hypothetical protein
MMKHLLAVALLSLASVVQADEALETKLLNEFMNYSMDCSSPIPNAAQTFQDYKKLNRIEEYLLKDKVLPLNVGTSSIMGGGLLLFTQSPLQGFVLGGGSSVLQVYSTPDFKQSVLFYMVTSEGPGPLELVLVNQQPFQPQLTCITLDTPKELNAGGWKMEYSLPVSFNIEPLGKGIIYTEATIDDAAGQPKTLWFAYHTQDGGQHWSSPQQLFTAPPKHLEGLYQLMAPSP